MPEKNRVLVADDTLPMRIMLQDVLSEAGYYVVTASDGEEAWNIIEEEGEALSLLIIDLLMPRMTGFEILEKLKEEGRLSKKSLVITGIFKSKKEVARLRDLGAAGYITKTALVDEILFRVNQVFHLGQENTRRYPRMLLSFPVSYRYGDEQYSNYSSNFSAGGVFIRTIEPPPRDELLSLKFRVPDIELEVKTTGRVAWNNEYESYRLKSSLPGMGVEFVDMDSSVQSELADFIKDQLADEPVWLD